MSTAQKNYKPQIDPNWVSIPWNRLIFWGDGPWCPSDPISSSEYSSGRSGQQRLGTTQAWRPGPRDQGSSVEAVKGPVSCVPFVRPYGMHGACEQTSWNSHMRLDSWSDLLLLRSHSQGLLFVFVYQERHAASLTARLFREACTRYREGYVKDTLWTSVQTGSHYISFCDLRVGLDRQVKIGCCQHGAMRYGSGI